MVHDLGFIIHNLSPPDTSRTPPLLRPPATVELNVSLQHVRAAGREEGSVGPAAEREGANLMTFVRMLPLSSEYGTYTTAKARLWPLL